MLGAAFVIACNAIVGFSDLERAGDPDDPTTRDRSVSDRKSSSSGGDGDLEVDSGPRCDPLKPFGTLTLAPGFDTSKPIARSAVRTPNELEAYFISGTGGSDFQLRRLTRAERGAAWSDAVTVPLETPPLTGLVLSAVGLKLYYYTCTGTSPLVCENRVTTRASLDETFPATGSRQVAAPSEIQIDLFATSNDDTVYYSALIADGGGHTAIFRAPLNANGANFGLQQQVKNLHMDGTDDDTPILNESETAMYLSSTRPGGGGGLGYDIWVSRRASKGADWGLPVYVPELSATGTDTISWVSSDDCEIYVSRADHVYLGRRPL